jgi:hypothetical protein
MNGNQANHQHALHPPSSRKKEADSNSIDHHQVYPMAEIPLQHHADGHEANAMMKEGSLSPKSSVDSSDGNFLID